MLLLLCRDPLEPTTPDRAFEAEAAAITSLGLAHALLDHDALVVDDDPDRAVGRVPEQAEPVLAAYRGWMLTPRQYGRLHEALSARGVFLISDPDQYRHCHYLPANYPVIQGHTPRSVWLTGDMDIDRIMEAVAPFGEAPLIVKDFVKSRKHEWVEACFISSAADRDAVSRVVAKFLELQGEDLAEGLVFREYVEFEPVGVHSKSGMPLTREYRGFWLDGYPIFSSAYWAEGVYGDSAPPIDQFVEVASAVRSRFFTMDIARRRDGVWMIVELGDGQVSGLPLASDAKRFYEVLRASWPDNR